MATQVGVGKSNHRNPEQAGKDAVAEAFKQAGVDSCDFVMMFATVGYDQQTILSAVRKATGNAPLSGCSGEGVIAQGFGNESNHAVTVMLWKSDELKFRNVHAIGNSKDPVAVGTAVAKELGDVKDALALFVMPDGLTFNFDRFSEGFRTQIHLDQPLRFIGGTAGDATTQTRTYQYHNGEAFSDGVSCALLYGKGDLFVEVSHGCQVIGAERTITKAEGTNIYEIDGKPAIEVMNEYLSVEEMKSHQMAMVALCLGFKAPKDLADYQEDDYYIRVIPSRDDSKGSISLYTEVQPGTKVWMTRRDPEKMLKGVGELTKRMRDKLRDRPPAAIMQFECMGRGKNMFREEEKMAILDTLQSQLGKQLPWIGFYCYGEIAPIAHSNYFHNYTTVLAAIT